MRIAEQHHAACVDIISACCPLAMGRRPAAQGAQSRHRRDAGSDLMNGLSKALQVRVDPSSPWFGKPTSTSKYDLAAREARPGGRYSKESR